MIPIKTKEVTGKNAEKEVICSLVHYYGNFRKELATSWRATRSLFTNPNNGGGNPIF